MNVQLYHGDCLQIMPSLPANSVDSIVCDPPAGIAFMGKDWDKDKGGRHQWIAWMTDVAAECLRLLKPGGHAFVWALPRTSHWTATAWEDAGFEIRDCVYHIFGSGFPKSKNLGNGWGSALKPAVECWWLLRKPLSEPTIAQNVLRWGTGALAIDKCRIEADWANDPSKRGFGYGWIGSKDDQQVHKDNANVYGQYNAQDVPWQPTQGRWPANLCLSEDAAALLDEMSGELHTHAGTYRREKPQGRAGHVYGAYEQAEAGTVVSRGDRGGASRFFLRVAPDDDEPLRFLYCGKASKRDRSSDGTVNNTHPTCKPQKLMSWLAKLVTPPNGTILDPFLGSGTTGVAAILEGFNFVGIELESEYLEISRKRIEHAQRTKAQMQPALLEVA